MTSKKEALVPILGIATVIIIAVGLVGFFTEDIKKVMTPGINNNTNQTQVVIPPPLPPIPIDNNNTNKTTDNNGTIVIEDLDLNVSNATTK